MNPIKVMVLGADPADMPVSDQIMWIVKESNDGPSESEHYIMTKKMIKQIDILVVEFQDRNLCFSDGVIMEMAYSTSTPIFMVAQTYQVPEYMEHMRTAHFTSLDNLIDHLQAHYF